MYLCCSILYYITPLVSIFHVLVVFRTCLGPISAISEMSSPEGSLNLEQDAQTSSQPRRPSAKQGLAVLAGIILPLTVVPFAITRRQLSGLRQRVDRLSAMNKTIMDELSSSRAEQDRLRTLVSEMRKDSVEQGDQSVRLAQILAARCV